MISFNTWNKHSRLLPTVARLDLICYQCPLLLYPSLLASGSLLCLQPLSVKQSTFTLPWWLLPETESPPPPTPSPTTIPPCFIFLLALRINWSDLLHLFLYLFIICFLHVARYKQHVCVLSRSVMSNSLQPHGLYSRPTPLSMGILQAGILPSSTGSSQPRDWTQVYCFEPPVYRFPNTLFGSFLWWEDP